MAANLTSLSIFKAIMIVDTIHKLSHQHLDTKFWIVEVDSLSDEAIPVSDIKRYPTSILISNFIDDFHFNL